MKKGILFIAALGLAVSGFATTTTKKEEKKASAVQVLPGSDMTFKVIYAKDNSEMVKVSLLDESGKAIQEDRIANKGGFYKPYDLSQLKEGNYTFQISDSEDTVAEVVKVSKSEVTASILPTNVKRGFKLLVPATHNHTVQVNIYNGSKLIKAEAINEKEGFIKRYDLSRAYGTDLNVKVYSQNKLIIAQTL